MTANIRGISAAIRNANDGISLTQTAEGSLTAIGDNLQRIRELAVQASNTGNNTSDRQALNAEATQLVAEIDRVANNSTFNGIKLLDGSFQNQSLQVGAGNDANDRITVSISSAKAASIGIGTSSSYTSNIAGAALTSGTALTSGGITINGVNVGASLSDGVSTVNSDGSALAKANAINAVSGSSGVTAEVQATTRTIQASATGGAYSLTVNGVTVSGIASSSTGIAETQKITLSGSSTSTSTKFLGVGTTVTAGDDATVTAGKIAAAKATILAAGSAGEALGITNITANGAELTITYKAGALGVTGAGDVSLLTANIAETGANTHNGVTFSSSVEVTKGVIKTDTATAQGNASEIAAALNAAKDLTGVSAKVDGTSGNYILSAADGRNITVTTTTATAGSTGVSNGTLTTFGSLKLNSTSPNGIVLGGLQATTAVLGANAQTATATQVQAGGVSSVDLSTALGAQSALTILDKAIDTITNSRAAMGAYQNRLTASISNLETTSMNLQASRSRILDTDYAKETTNLAKSQIITQAATAMLAQANQSAQSVLALLK
jgi:flagellin